MAGIWGLLSVALFAEKDSLENIFSNEFGIFKGGPWRFLGVQLLTVVVVSAWAALATFLELLLVNQLLGLRMSVEDELMGADKVEHGIDEHDPNSTLDSYDINVKENGHEDAVKTVEVNLIGLEAAEIHGTLRRYESREKDSRNLIRARKKLPRPKWRKKVSFRSPPNDNLSNSTFPMNSSFSNGGVNLAGDMCNAQTANGSVVATESSNYMQQS